MLRHIKAVLFDLDGTLIDSATDLGRAADKMRTDRGMPSFSDAHYRPLAGAGARGMLALAFNVTPDAAEFEALREEFFANYLACMFDHTAAFAQVPQLLQNLEACGLPWGVVTNKAARFTQPLVQRMALFERCAVVVSGDTTPHAKPHPAPLLEAARRLDINAHDCLYVGDDERDIVAGRAAGMQTVAALYGYLGANARVSDWQADAAINSPAELLQCLPTALT